MPVWIGPPSASLVPDAATAGRVSFCTMPGAYIARNLVQNKTAFPIVFHRGGFHYDDKINPDKFASSDATFGMSGAGVCRWRPFSLTNGTARCVPNADDAHGKTEISAFPTAKHDAVAKRHDRCGFELP